MTVPCWQWFRTPAMTPTRLSKVSAIGFCNKPLQDKDLPLINRVTQGLYPPASTVKPYMAMSALLDGVITPQTRFFGAPHLDAPGHGATLP